GSCSRLFNPTVIDQQFVLNDLRLARYPGHPLDAAMLCQRFAGRDHLHLALAVADWIAAGVEHWLWWHSIIDGFVGPDVACRPIDAAICWRERIKIVDIDHAFLPSTTSLKSPPACFGTNAATVRPAALQT